MPDHKAETVLSNSRGEAWTNNGFSTVWHSFKTALENEGLIEKGLTLRGLRHTLATTLRDAGRDERRIAELLGQKTKSYEFVKWCPGAESNHRHEDFQSTALPLSYPGTGAARLRVAL